MKKKKEIQEPKATYGFGFQATDVDNTKETHLSDLSLS